MHRNQRMPHRKHHVIVVVYRLLHSSGSLFNDVIACLLCHCLAVAVSSGFHVTIRTTWFNSLCILLRHCHYVFHKITSMNIGFSTLQQDFVTERQCVSSDVWSVFQYY
jgi:hypothetical protein